MRRVLLLAPILLSCRADEAAPLEVTILAPAYGTFHGDGPVAVLGRVSDASASVYLGGERIPVLPDGTFHGAVPLEREYAILHAEAWRGGEYARYRVPVFAGRDPMRTWPGVVSLRITDLGLARLGERLGGTVDATGWSSALLAALPALRTDWLTVRPTSLSHEPTVVALEGGEDGIDTRVSLRDVTLEFDVELPSLGWSAPVTVGWSRIDLGVRAVPELDADGHLSVALSGPVLDLDQPIFAVDGASRWAPERLLNGLAWAIEPVGALFLDVLLDTLGALPLGGPYAFATELSGLSLDVRLTDVRADEAGFGVELGVEGTGVPLRAPFASEIVSGAHAALGLHEGLLQATLAQAVAERLTVDLELPDTLFGASIRSLPGGGEAPADAQAWCVSATPGDARLARAEPGPDPLATVHLPDLQLRVGADMGAGCEDWLVASLATEVGVEAGGSTRVEVTEGAVLAYGASPGSWEEAEVVDGLGSLLERTVTPLDLPLPLDRVLGAVEMDGAPEGTVALSLELWPE